jgi:hypothetical protein
MAIAVAPTNGRTETSSRSLNLIFRGLPPIAPTSGPRGTARSIKLERRHYQKAVVSVALAYTLYFAIVHYVRFANLSVLSGLGQGIGALLGHRDTGLMLGFLANIIVLNIMVMKVILTKRSLGSMALYEEEDFRAGAEDWSIWQRVRSNALFGIVHIFNLFVPIAAVIGLGSAGWWFMAVYLRAYRNTGSRVSALEESGAVHAAHNRLALYSLPVVIILNVIVVLLKKYA